MRHIKLFEGFVDKDLFKKISEEEYRERYKSIKIIDGYFKKSCVKTTYQNILKDVKTWMSHTCLVFDIIDKRSDGTNGDYKVELSVHLTDDYWFIVCVNEYEWLGSWRNREFDGVYLQSTYWKCDDIEGLMSFIENIKTDMWGFLGL